MVAREGQTVGWMTKLIAAGLCLMAVAVSAQEVPGEPDPELEELVRLRSQHAERVEIGDEEAMDTAVFTELSPYAAEQTAVRLPDDQRLD